MTADLAIVTVVRNDLEGIRRTWDSLGQQTFTRWEWIVVDGNSADGTQRWLVELQDARVLVRSEADRGIYDAMNKGTARTNAGLVTYLNAGDVLAAPSVLDQAMASYEQHGWRWAYGRIDLADNNGHRVGQVVFEPFSEWQLRMGRQAVPHPGAFFARDLLDQVGPYREDYPVTADQELMLRAAQLATPFELCRTMVVFELGGTSSNARPDEWIRESRRARFCNGRLAGGAILDGVLTTCLSLERRVRLRRAQGARGIQALLKHHR